MRKGNEKPWKRSEIIKRIFSYKLVLIGLVAFILMLNLARAMSTNLSLEETLTKEKYIKTISWEETLMKEGGIGTIGSNDKNLGNYLIAGDDKNFAGGSYPEIINAKVEPLKVQPGDVLITTVEFKDDYGIVSAVASYGHENKDCILINLQKDCNIVTDEIPMSLIKGNKLKGTYKAAWVVHDTKVKKYYTTIYLTNKKGLTSMTKLEWWDPVVGHNASAISAGTFDSGNFTFPDDLYINDRLGIGTTSPASKLTVWDGDLNVSNATATALFVDEDNGRVGIGDINPTSPFSKFYINNTSAPSSFALLIDGGAPAKSQMRFRANDPRYRSDIQLLSGGLSFTARDDIGNTHLPIKFFGDYIWFRGIESTSYIRFETNDKDRMRIDPSGKVGIGTTNPQQKLNVVGNANITGEVDIENFKSCTALETNSSGGLVCGSDNTGMDYTGIMMSNETDNINTSHILDKTILPIDMSSSFNDTYDVRWNQTECGDYSCDLASGTTLNSATIQTGTDLEGVEDYTNLALTNQTNSFTNNITFDDEVEIAKGLNLSQYQSCSALETDAAGNLLCGSDATGGGGMDYTNLALENRTNYFTLLQHFGAGLNITGDINITGDLNITGGVNLSSFTSCTALETDAEGNLVCGSDNGGSMDYTNLAMTNESNSFGNHDQTFDTDTLFLDAAGDKIGIGTITPNSKLTVWDGDLNVSNATATALFVDGDNGRVGIGTTSPGYKLHVVPSSAGDGVIVNATGTNSPEFGLRGPSAYLADFSLALASGHYGADATAGDAVIRVNNSDLIFSTTSTGGYPAKMIIDSSGNVGIGTTGPDQKLHVTGGEIKLEGSGGGRLQVYDGSGNLGYRVRSNNSGGWRWQFVDGTNSEYFGVNFSSGDTTIKGILSVDGAGDNYFAGNLQVDGTASITGVINADATSTAISADGDLVFTGSGDIIDFSDSATDKVHWYSNTYGTGIESSTLTDWSGSQFRWRVGGTSVSGGTERMLLDSSGNLQMDGDLTVSGGNVNLPYGNNALESVDEWLRINDGGEHSSGVYMGTSVLGVGNIYVGGSTAANGEIDLLTNGNINMDGTLTAADIECTTCVDTGDLKTATAISQGTTGGGGTWTNIVMNDYSFFPNIYRAASGDDRSIGSYNSNVANQIGRFSIYGGSAARAYKVRWRYITASRPPEIFVWYDLENKVLRHIWRSEIEHSEYLPVELSEVPKNADGKPLWIPVQLTVFDKSLLKMDGDELRTNYTITRYEKPENISSDDELLTNPKEEGAVLITHPDIYYGKLEYCSTCADSLLALENNSFKQEKPAMPMVTTEENQTAKILENQQKIQELEKRLAALENMIERSNGSVIVKIK